MSVPTINSIELKGCESIDTTKNPNIIPLTMPTGDSDETELFDMMGVVKTITASGTISKGTIAETKSWVDSLEALADGDQDITVDFVSEQTGTIKVMVALVDINWSLPGFKADYTIKMIQGNSL